MVNINADEHPELRKPVIHLADGMLNLETMEIDDFSPEYYSRNQIPIAFDENADCPRFLNELLASALDDEDIEVIQKYFGMCLLGHNYSQQFLLLEGTPGGGKSTLVDVLRQIIGRRNEVISKVLQKMAFDAFAKSCKGQFDPALPRLCRNKGCYLACPAAALCGRGKVTGACRAEALSEGGKTLPLSDRRRGHFDNFEKF